MHIHEFLVDLILQLQKFKSLRICLQILWQKFCWRVLAMACRMIYWLYFLDAWSQIFLSLKITCFDYKLIELWLLWKYGGNQIDFLWFRKLFSNPFILITTYRIEMIKNALDRWDVRLLNAHTRFNFWATEHLGNTF